MKMIALVVLLLIGSRSMGQYDLGISAGGFVNELNGLILEPIGAGWSAGLMYRSNFQ